MKFQALHLPLTLRGLVATSLSTSGLALRSKPGLRPAD